MNNSSYYQMITVGDHIYDISTNTLTIGKGITELNKVTLSNLINEIKSNYKNQISNNKKKISVNNIVNRGNKRSSKSEKSVQDQCAICYDDWKENKAWPKKNNKNLTNINISKVTKNMIKLGCGHIFHKKCLEDWFSTQKIKKHVLFVRLHIVIQKKIE